MNNDTVNIPTEDHISPDEYLNFRKELDEYLYNRQIQENRTRILEMVNNSSFENLWNRLDDTRSAGVLSALTPDSHGSPSQIKQAISTPRAVKVATDALARLPINDFTNLNLISLTMAVRFGSDETSEKAFGLMQKYHEYVHGTDISEAQKFIEENQTEYKRFNQTAYTMLNAENTYHEIKNLQSCFQDVQQKLRQARSKLTADPLLSEQYVEKHIDNLFHNTNPYGNWKLKSPKLKKPAFFGRMTTFLEQQALDDSVDRLNSEISRALMSPRKSRMKPYIGRLLDPKTSEETRQALEKAKEDKTLHLNIFKYSKAVQEVRRATEKQEASQKVLETAQNFRLARTLQKDSTKITEAPRKRKSMTVDRVMEF